MDERDKLLIFGYVRNEEKIQKLSNIPMAILYLCLLYYYEPECFAQARPDCFRISGDGLSITNIKFCSIYEHSIYLNRWIPSNTDMIYKWIFKIEGIDSDVNTIDEPFASIYFGLVSKCDKVNPEPSDTAITAIPNYGISNRGHRYENCLGEYSKIRDKNWHFDKGDTLKYILNLKNNTWSFQKNNGTVLEIFKTIQKLDETRYKFAVQSTLKGLIIKLEYFCTEYPKVDR